METAIFAWNWVASAGPDLTPALTQCLVDAWVASMQQSLGLFNAGAEDAEPEAVDGAEQQEDEGSGDEVRFEDRVYIVFCVCKGNGSGAAVAWDSTYCVAGTTRPEAAPTWQHDGQVSLVCMTVKTDMRTSYCPNDHCKTRREARWGAPLAPVLASAAAAPSLTG